MNAEYGEKRPWAVPLAWTVRWSSPRGEDGAAGARLPDPCRRDGADGACGDHVVVRGSGRPPLCAVRGDHAGGTAQRAGGAPGELRVDSLGSAIANAPDGSNPANVRWPNNARVRFVVDTNEQADELGEALQAQDNTRNRADAVRVLNRITGQQAEPENRTYLQQVTADLQQQINSAGVGLAALGAFAVHSGLR